MFVRLLRFLGVLALASTIVWLTREHLLPTPKVSHEPPPHYRSTPPPPPTPTTRPAPDDLTDIKGIGPVFAMRLGAIGIDSFKKLSETDIDTLTDAAGTSSSNAADWIKQANAKVT